MKALSRWLVTMILLLTGMEGLGQERFAAPTFVNGDFWQYRVVEHGDYMKTERELNGLYEISYSNGWFKVFKREQNRKNELNSEMGILLGLVSQTALQQLQFPLFTGKSWTTDYVFRPQRRDVDRSVRAVTKVKDFAEVTTNTGTFKAYKLERDVRFKNIDHWTFVYYWSSQTKGVVKYQNGSAERRGHGKSTRNRID